LVPEIEPTIETLLVIVRRGRPDEDLGKAGVAVAVALVAMAPAFSAWAAVQML
jgi:hypothetical protein